MFTIIARVILRNRIFLIVLLTLISLFFLFQARKVTFSYEPAVLVPKTDSVLIEFNKYREVFGEDANIVVIGVEDPEFFKKEHFLNWVDLTDSLKKLDGIKDVFSIT